jgi:hypothetical protein
MKVFCLFLVAAFALSVSACGGGGGSLESQLSKKSKLTITDCKKTDKVAGIVRIPNTQAYSCKYKDTVTGELHGYIALTDAKGKPLEGRVDPLG